MSKLRRVDLSFRMQYATFALLLVLTPALAKSTSKAADKHGDPLPDGAVARCGTLCLRPSTISAPIAAISGTGNFVAAEGFVNGTIDIWNLQTGHRWRTVSVGSSDAESAIQCFRCFTFSPDGGQVAAALPEGRTIVWNVWTGNRLAELSTPQVRLATYSRDVLALTDGRTHIWLYNRHDYSLWATISVEANVRALALSADGTEVVAAGADFFDYDDRRAQILHWSISADGATKALRTIDVRIKGKVHDVQLSEDARHVAFATGHEIAVFGADSGTPEWVVHRTMFSTSGVAFAPDGMTLAAQLSDNDMQVATCDGQKEVSIFTGHVIPVERLAYSVNGNYLMGTTPHRIYVWDVSSQELLPYCTGHASITSVAFSSSGGMLATEGECGPASYLIDRGVQAAVDCDDIRLWDTQSGKLTRRLPGGHLTDCGRDSNTFLTWTTQGHLREWSFKDGRLRRDFMLPLGDAQEAGRTEGSTSERKEEVRLTGMVRSSNSKRLLLCMNSKHIAVSDDLGGTMHVLPVGDRDLPIGATEVVTTLDMSDDGARGACVVTHDDDAGGHLGFKRSCVIMDLEDLKVLHRIKLEDADVEACRFSPDGSIIAMVSRGVADLSCKVSLWRVSSGETVCALDGGIRWERLAIGPGYDLRPLTFSPDGRFIVAGDVDGALHLWSPVTGKRIRRVLGHSGAIATVRFSADGEWVATGSVDSTVLTWSFRELLRGRNIE